MSDETPIRVAVADPDTLFRDLVAEALATEVDLDVVSRSARADTTLAEVRRWTPDVVCVSASVPVSGGARLCADIKRCLPSTKVVLTCDQPDNSVLLAAVRAGADGFVTKDEELDEMIGAVRMVHGGRARIPEGMLAVLLRDLIERRREEDSAVARFSRLTRREREIVGLLVKGYDRDAIARELTLSPHTARTHVQNVLEKLEVHSRLEAATLAVEFDLLDRFRIGSEDA